ncbi:ATP-dependent DNA ligase [Evansella halocellulosilytica]|uniref:ATP-dependent DNA ligase n=1 Tax=Evansella halocellulosilytica TaxID=2011013 RepID=UPI000BB8860A|nr:RNA ligase family protein [Evansella halocellulosilytica]
MINNEVTGKFPELQQIDIPDGTILDGELIVPGPEGKPDFEAMMERFMSNKKKHPIQFVVFDIIYHENKKVASLPLYLRKELLAELALDSSHIVLSKWLEGNAEAYFDLVQQQGLEGIVMKESHSKYEINKRSRNWLKVITYQYADVAITGLRKKEFGVLLSSKDGQYMGLMEFMPPKARKEFYGQYKELIVDENDKFIYLTPEIKCKVKYRNLTKRGLLRIPSFVAW